MMHAPTVRDLMHSPVITVTRHTRLPVIKRMLREHTIRRLPVVEHDQLIGIITLGDVRNAFPSDAAALGSCELSYLIDKVTAEEIMRTDVITVDADLPVVEAAQCMLTHKVSGLPVLACGRMVGIITEADILRSVIAGQLPLPTVVEQPLASLQVAA
jgi:acetoin utilization protein AcuB